MNQRAACGAGGYFDTSDEAIFSIEAEHPEFFDFKSECGRGEIVGDPVAYRNDLIRAIFAGARELGWNRDRVHAFAEDKLVLKDPLGSLKDLGPVQLTTLADAVQRAVRSARAERRREVAEETG